MSTDWQDEIIPHLEPGRLPSTVDPDALQAGNGKKVAQRPVRISAWKLAKLDSSEAIKAGAKARASSSVLRPISSKHHQYDTDYVSSTNMSGKSSPSSTHHGFYERNAKAGTSRMSSTKSSYPPSRASREDIETCNHSISNLSSPLAGVNLTPSPMGRGGGGGGGGPGGSSNRDHFNPIYQSSADQSPLSAIGAAASAAAVDRNEALPVNNTNLPQIPARRNNTNAMENSKSSSSSVVVWDQEAGRFVSSAANRGITGGTSSSTSQFAGAELTYTGQSIFFGGPLVNDQLGRGTRAGGSQQRSSSSSGFFQQGGVRPQRGGQLPVFVPSEFQQNQSSSRFQ